MQNARKTSNIQIPRLSLVIADAPLIEELLRREKIASLGSHRQKCIVSDHLRAEISDLMLQARYQQAITDHHLREEELRELAELETFLKLGINRRLSFSEQAATTLAIHRRCKLVIDYNSTLEKALNEAGIDARGLVICHPREILLDMMRSNSLSDNTIHGTGSALTDLNGR